MSSLSPLSLSTSPSSSLSSPPGEPLTGDTLTLEVEASSAIDNDKANIQAPMPFHLDSTAAVNGDGNSAIGQLAKFQGSPLPLIFKMPHGDPVTLLGITGSTPVVDIKTRFQGLTKTSFTWDQFRAILGTVRRAVLRDGSAALVADVLSPGTPLRRHGKQLNGGSGRAQAVVSSSGRPPPRTGKGEKSNGHFGG